jgi:integrase
MATDYVWKRPNTNSLWFSMAVPKEFQETAGRKLVQRSLGTPDRREASIRAGRLRAELFEQWSASAPAVGASPTIPSLALAAHLMMLDRLEEERRATPRDDASHDAHLAMRGADMRRLARRKIDGDLAQWEGIANRLIERHTLPIAPGTASYNDLVDAVAEASVEALSVFTRRHTGEFDAAPKGKLLREAAEREANLAPAGETLLQLFDQYAEQRLRERAKRADVLKQDRKVIEQFSGFVGPDRNVSTITALEVRDFRNTLRKLPPKWRERREFRNMSMRDAAAKAEGLELPQVAMTTINKYLSTISPLFAWMIEEKYDIVNPCTGLFHQRVKGKNPRPPFSTAQLNQILQSPLFSGYLAAGKEHIPGDARADDWRYWVPLIAMFTGARIGEIAQLNVADFHLHEDGFWWFLIRNDEGTGQSTKSGFDRPAIVHSTLVGLGFVAFLTRQRLRARDDGNTQLFADLKPDTRGQVGAAPSRFWRDYLAAIGLKEGRDGFGSHSFRHTMADRLREEGGLLDDQIEVALGHNQKTVTGGYGQIRQGTVLVPLHNIMESVVFKGVDFTHLIALHGRAAQHV